MKLFFAAHREYETSEIAVRFLKFLKEICHQQQTVTEKRNIICSLTFKKT